MPTPKSGLKEYLAMQTCGITIDNKEIRVHILSSGRDFRRKMFAKKNQT
jgi:hypothetical protein